MAIKAVGWTSLSRKSMRRANEKGVRIELGESTYPGLGQEAVYPACLERNVFGKERLQTQGVRRTSRRCTREGRGEAWRRITPVSGQGCPVEESAGWGGGNVSALGRSLLPGHVVSSPERVSGAALPG